jgi:polar amino acid transport system ATP-binding protein
MHSNADFNGVLKKERQFDSNSKSAIKIEDLYKAFGNLKVLQGISTEIHQGELLQLLVLLDQENQLFYAA